VHGLNNPFKELGTRNWWWKRVLPSFYESLRRRALRDSDLVLLAADQRGLDPFQRAYPTAASIVTLPNFCDTATFGIHAERIDPLQYGVPADGRILLYVGRLSQEKDPVLAIRILAALRPESAAEEIQLVMIGAGSMQEEVQKEAKRLGVMPHLTMLGMQPRSAIAGWMRSADLLLLTSHFEGFPIVLAEAAQCGLPMVTPDITGVHDLVIPGQTGSVVASRRPQDFVAPILETLANRDAQSKQALKVAEQFTPELVLERLCQEIADVL
jgi:glycosyltransferase involved in cell wall biosynthesis